MFTKPYFENWQATTGITEHLQFLLLLETTVIKHLVVVVYQDGQKYVATIHIVYVTTNLRGSIQTWQGMKSCKVGPLVMYLSWF